MKFIISKYDISIVEDYIILFLFTFGLNIPILKTTSLLLLFFLPIRLCMSSKSLRLVFSIIHNKYFYNLIYIYLFIIFLIILSSTIQLAFDYRLVKTLINATLHMVVAIMIVSLLIYKRRSTKYLLIILIGIFVIQSIIQIGAFFNSNILHFVQIFQSAETIERADIFSGRKGLALAGTVFFGLASIYGLIFFIYFEYIIIKKAINFKDIIIFVLLFVGGFFTGRTFFIGVGLSLCYLLCSSLSNKKKTLIISKIFLGIFILICIFLLVIPPQFFEQINNLFLYVFEIVYNYINTGHASTTSSDHLLNDMYFPVSLKTLLIGDGKYVGDTGGYYMNTDAGYMRNILLFGLIGLCTTIYFDIKLLWGDTILHKRSISKLSSFIFLYISILHIKGESFAYLITLHSVLFVFYFFYVFSQKYSIKYNDN